MRRGTRAEGRPDGAVRSTATTPAAILALVAFAASMAVGAVHAVTVCWLSLVSGVAMLLLARSAKAHVSLGLLPFVALSAFTLLQSIPMSAGVVTTLSPDLAETWRKANELRGVVEGPLFLSLDPASTRIEALKLLLYAAAWAGAFNYARRHGVRAAAQLVFFVALSLLAASLAHRIGGTIRVFGIYQPTYASIHSSPLLNANNESGLLNLGAFCGLGLFLSAKNRRVAASLSLVGVAALVGGSVLTASRGGTLTLLLGFVAAAILLVVRSRRRGTLDYVPPVAILGTLLVGALFFLFAADQNSYSELRDRSLDKLRLFDWAWDVASQHPWTGVGRAALGSELSRYREGPGASFFESAENWPLDFLAGWGLPIGAASIAMLLFALNPRRLLRRTSRLHLALYVGVLTLVVQNCIDLGFEVPGVVVPVVVLLASLWGGRYVEAGANRPTIRWPLGTLGALLLIGGGVLLLFPQRKAREERRALAGPARSGKLTVAAVKDVLGRHPGDSYVLRLGAVAEYRAGNPSALRWLNRSLIREPNNGRSYLLLAQLVQSRGGTEHAIVALKKAVSTDPSLTAEAARLALHFSPANFVAAVPESEAGARMLLEFARQSKDLEERIELVKRAILRNPALGESHLDAAGLWLQAADSKHALCQGRPTNCLDEARAALARAEAGKADPVVTLTLQGRLISAEGQSRKAYELLLERCPRQLKYRSCLLTLLAVAKSLTDPEFRVAADAYLDGLCSRSSACDAAQNEVAGMFEQRGDYGAALSLRRSLAQLDGGAARWLAVARVAEKLGRTHEAARAKQRADAATPPE